MSEIDTSTTVGKIAVMSAFDRGEQVQSKIRGSDSWGISSSPAWIWSEFDYRTTPKPDPYAELKAAHARGEVIQIWSGVDWADFTLPPLWRNSPENYRIKPTPKRVPLEAKDVPPICWIGNGLSSSGSLVLVVGSERIQFVGRDGLMDFTFGYLMDHDLKYSTDRKEWKECSKLEEAK